MKRAISIFSLIYLLSFLMLSSVAAQALTHLVGKGGVEFSANYLSYERELKFTKFEEDGEERTDAGLDSLNRESQVKIKNPIYYLQTTFGFAGNIQLQFGVGASSQDFKLDDKTVEDEDFTIESDKMVFVKLGLGSGYHFPFGLLLTGKGAVSVYPLTDVGDTINFEGDGAFGEWESGLTAGYEFIPAPSLSLMPFAGFEYTGAFQYLSGTGYDNGSESDLDMQLRERSSNGSYFGLDLSWKKLFLKGEAHFGARKGAFLQAGVRL